MAEQHKLFMHHAPHFPNWCRIITMARSTSSIETHPQRQRIVESICAGQTLREIASWTNPPVSQMAISRFKSRAMVLTAKALNQATSSISKQGDSVTEQGVQAVTRAALAVAVDPFLSRVAHLDAERERLKRVAEGNNNLGAWSALDGNDLRALELHAKLAGRLDAGTHIQVSVVVPSTARNAPAEPEGMIIDIKTS